MHVIDLVRLLMLNRYRLLLASSLMLAASAALAAPEPAATAPIPPPTPTVPANPTPPKPLFVAPTVEMPKKAAPVQATTASPVLRPVKPQKHVVATARAKPSVRHVRREKKQYYARAITPRPPHYAMQEAEGPSMPPPGWYGPGPVGPGPGYPYPGPPRHFGYW